MEEERGGKPSTQKKLGGKTRFAEEQYCNQEGTQGPY